MRRSSRSSNLDVAGRRAGIEWLWVACGGALGAVARTAVGELVASVLGAGWTATAAINFAGAFSLGVLLAVLERIGPRPRLRAFLAVGFLGSFTTFSSLVAEAPPAIFATAKLPAALATGAHLAFSIAVGVGAFAIGDRVVRSTQQELPKPAPGSRRRS